MDKRVPSLSIVTPSFNQGLFIKEAIESVASQRYSDVEHLIIDGGSKDETVNILRRCSETWPHVKWSSEPDGGQSEALNRGFRQSTGDLIGWLNSDDRYRPGSFECVTKAFAENPDVDVIYGDYAVIDRGGDLLKIKKEIEFNPFILKYYRVLYIATTATFFRRRIFTEGNWLDEKLHYAMDYEFFVRLVAAGYRFKHIPGLLADMRIHPASKASTMTEVVQKERDSLMYAHSQISQKIRLPWLQRVAFSGAQTVAATMRYSEKMTRGYYRAQLQAEFLKAKSSHVNS